MSQKIVKVIDLVPGRVQPLATVDAAAMDARTFHDEHVSKHQPVVIKGAARHWPAVERWKTLGYLESRCEGVDTNISRTFNPLPAAPYFDNAVVRRKLSECIAEMRGAADSETYSMPSIGLPAQCEEDLGQFSFFDDHPGVRPRIYPPKRFFVYRNASTEWHYHPVDESLTTQLVGSKRVSMFRLSQENWARYVEPIEANFHHMECGRQFFPRDPADLVKYEATLEPGDTLYIPPFWWHGIDPADTGFGVTLAQCFRTPLRRLGSWQEPVTRRMVKHAFASNKRFVLLVLALLTASSMSRYFAGEKW